ncbi:TetR/AcrR family transcriptional regulator [Microlunatus elymi]|uniref:TetR/AcrR family transcriptional regulator n=1 Tax=Microlunatus elymi TaxID=2596828 RepID=A0A516PUW9_9ACTN|nr:TetR family transcriptional regulator [Microlunatus elymi]QDP94984.1 TetR/AcrR family transcriptional regulator [Microlunatus elymi]
MPQQNSRPGRWRTGEQSRERILDAARRNFGERGYAATTIRAIAAEADVDPAMVHYFFTNKAQLFATSMQLPAIVPELITRLLEPGVDGLGERIVRHFVGIWDDRDRFDPLFALMRSAESGAATPFKEFIEREIVARIEQVIDSDDAQLRSQLVGSQLIGLAFARYVVHLEPLASADPDTLVRLVGPTIQHYVSG